MSFDVDSGGGGASTPWYSTDMDHMWLWVNRDLSPHYQQANSWKKIGELYGLYQYRLQAFRDRLAQSWNPATSKAAEAYLTKLDDLIRAVKNVEDVASRNYQAAVDIPNAISEAKYKLKPIYEAYKSAQRQHNSLLGPMPIPSPSPSGARPPAVVMNDKHNEAETVMYQLSADLSRAQAGLGRPVPYEAPGRRDDGGQYSGGGMPMPVIPAVIPSNVPTSMPGGPVSPMPAPTAPNLSGLQPTLPGLPGPGSPGPVGPFPTPGPTPGPTPAPAFPPGGIIPSNTTPMPPRPGPGLVTGPVAAAPSRGVPGGVIGGAPPPRSTGGVRPNPVGGMIGGATPGPRGTTGPVGGGVVGRTPGGTGTPGARASTGAAGGFVGRGAGGAPGTPGVAGTAGRGAGGAMAFAGRGNPDDEEGQHFDPDTPWEVAQGVAPIVEAPKPQRPIDPGPAIGLST